MDSRPETQQPVPDEAHLCGWQSSFSAFYHAHSESIVDRLRLFVRDAGQEQSDAWRVHVPAIQTECREMAAADQAADDYSVILEYQLPYDFRRPDLIVLEQAAVVVVEMKGRQGIGRAALDQVLAYARDLRAYHEDCQTRAVVPVLVSAEASSPPSLRDSVWVCHPTDADSLMSSIARQHPGPALVRDEFLREDAYVPLPSIVQAARQLFETKDCRSFAVLGRRLSPRSPISQK